jgi:hypothetical protein
VTITPIKLKIPALRLRAMLESDFPKQAAQASTLAGEANPATTAAAANVTNFFIDN